MLQVSCFINCCKYLNSQGNCKTPLLGRRCCSGKSSITAIAIMDDNDNDNDNDNVYLCFFFLFTS